MILWARGKSPRISGLEAESWFCEKTEFQSLSMVLRNGSKMPINSLTSAWV